MEVVFITRFPSNCLFLKEIAAYQELLSVVILLGSSINHEDDENEIIRKANDLISKTKTLNMLII